MRLAGYEFGAKYLVLAAVALVIVLVTGVKLYANSEARDRVDEAIAEVSQYASIEYDSVKGKLFSGAAVLEGVTVSPAAGFSVGEEVRIDRIEVQAPDSEEDQIPPSMSVRIEGVAVDIEDMDSQDARAMRDLGYEGTMKSNLRFSYDYDPEAESLSLRDIAFGIDDFGEASLDLELDSIDPKMKDLGTLLLTHQQILVGDLKLSYRDDSFFQRLVEYRARELGMSEEQVKQSVISGIEGQMKGADSKSAKQSLENLKKFFEDPERISIIASPDEPHNIGELMGIGSLEGIIERMNVRVEL